MNSLIMDWGKSLIEKYVKDGAKTLDIGSLDVNGSFREFFKGEYIGIDIREGKGVDYVMNGNDLDLDDNSIDVVVCMNMLEHDLYFWKTVSEINRVLKKDGLLFVSVPTIKFPLHDHPSDYYRFTEEALRCFVFDGYDIIDLTGVLTKGVNPVINVLGRKK